MTIRAIAVRRPFALGRKLWVLRPSSAAKRGRVETSKEEGELQEAGPLFALPVALFADAGTSFDAGAYYGTSILCRAALEASLYLFLTRSKNGQPSGAWV